MAKVVEEQMTEASVAAPLMVAPTDAERLLTVRYSASRDLYFVAAAVGQKEMWLSVAVYPLEARYRRATNAFLGSVRCAEADRGFRKAYSTKWSMVAPEGSVTLPANDPLVADYLSGELIAGEESL